MPDLIRDVPCLVCGKTMEREAGFEIIAHDRDSGRLSIGPLYDGVICQARGNYGSTAHDPLVDTTEIAFALCDGCFRGKRHLMTDSSTAVVSQVVRLWQDPDDSENAWTTGTQIRLRGKALGRPVLAHVSSGGSTIPEALRNLAEAIERVKDA